ncbi:uncharacterized protein LOC129618016 [Condylostylus longicornis]|uniref:uncharacterized protein LOC129618016 n=1 Tax=Condylostylus longicornis TaxID=2530218 RepID=UPI00244E4D8C|nr:uncharacterized protein LOC129618016 [Condylostylus longicornis]
MEAEPNWDLQDWLVRSSSVISFLSSLSLTGFDETGYGSGALDEFGQPIPDEVLLAQAQSQAGPLGDFFSDEAFAELAGGFKGTDGKFLAMTAYGAVPLPDQMLKSIPEKLVSRPIVQERDIFVLKQEERTRVVERDYTQFEHSFVDIPKALVVDKIELQKRTRIIEVPHFNYKPIVEDKIVEIPLGIKYVEIPIEVACRAPPRIVPVPKPHIVERIIETTKPVVQEKIIEVPEVVRRKVSGRVNPSAIGLCRDSGKRPDQLGERSDAATAWGSEVEERRKRLFGASQFKHFVGTTFQGYPSPYQGTAPPQFGGQPAFPPPAGKARVSNFPMLRAYIKDDALVVQEAGVPGEPQTFYLTQGIRHVQLPYEAEIEVAVVEQEEVPEGVPIAQPHVRYMAPGSRALAYNDGRKTSSRGDPQDAIYAGPMDPIVSHAAPGMRAIEFKTKGYEPDILTQQGVIKYSKFECCLSKDEEHDRPEAPVSEPPPLPSDLDEFYRTMESRPLWRPYQGREQKLEDKEKSTEDEDVVPKYIDATMPWT